MRKANNPKIELREVKEDNLWEITKLSVKEEQKEFVATPVQSILQAYVAVTSSRHAFPFGIYADDQLVGFVMFGFHREDEEDPEVANNNYCIWRFLIDKEYQQKGYGKVALIECLSYLKRTLPCGDAKKCWLDVDPRNQTAIALYESQGFYKNGEVCDGEIVMEINL